MEKSQEDFPPGFCNQQEPGRRKNLGEQYWARRLGLQGVQAKFKQIKKGRVSRRKQEQKTLENVSLSVALGLKQRRDRLQRLLQGEVEALY